MKDDQIANAFAAFCERCGTTPQAVALCYGSLTREQLGDGDSITEARRLQREIITLNRQAQRRQQPGSTGSCSRHQEEARQGDGPRPFRFGEWRNWRQDRREWRERHRARQAQRLQQARLADAVSGAQPPEQPEPGTRDPAAPGGDAFCFASYAPFSWDSAEAETHAEPTPSFAPAHDPWSNAGGATAEHENDVAAVQAEFEMFARRHTAAARTQHPAGNLARAAGPSRGEPKVQNCHYATQHRELVGEVERRDIDEAIKQLQSVEAVRLLESRRTANYIDSTLEALITGPKRAGNSSSHAAQGALASTTQGSLHLQQRALQMAQSLKADVSRWALHGASEAQLHEACATLTQILDEGKPKSAHGNENSAWRHWLSFCTTFGTDPWRNNPDNLTSEGRERETITLALAFTHIYSRMSNRPGRLFPPKPQSALQVLRTIRRMHARLGIEMIPLTLVTRLVHALNRRYVSRFGIESLQPQRVEPLTNSLIRAILSESMEGKAVGSSTVAWASREWQSIRALIATLAQTGFRRDEISLSRGEALDGTKMTRASVRYRLGGVDRPSTPTEAELRSMQEGDFVLIIPAACKTDQVGLEWGQKPIWLPFSATAPICAARELRDMELGWPAPKDEQRARTPLFTDRAGRALVSDKLNALLRDMLVASGQVSRERSRVYTLHSFRRYLACALLASGADSFTIMALLRWKTDESLKVYADFNPSTYGAWISTAGGADISSIRTRNLPRTDYLDLAATQEKYDHQLQREASNAQAINAADDVVSGDVEDCSDEEAGEQQEQHGAPQPPPQPRRRPAARAQGGGRRQGGELLQGGAAPKRARAAATPKPSKVRVGRRSYEISQDDPRSLVGCDVDMPNEAWGAEYADGGSTCTRVLHHAPLASGDGSDAYICEAEGIKYLFRASDIAAASTASA